MIATLWNDSWTAALVNHLWQSTVVIGIAWLLALALRPNHARVRYWVWFAASAKFLLPFSLLIAAGEWMRSLLARPIVETPAVAVALQQIAQPFAQAQLFELGESPAAAQRAEWLPIALLAIWACGALIVLARFGRGWWLALEAKRTARPLELAADVPVWSSPKLIEPGIFGIFQPVLLLPDGILERLTPEHVQSIVAHEMCHVRRRDNLTYAIHMLVETLFWFHPLAWWLGARLVEERERACDEAVLDATRQPFAYAEGILNICKLYVEAPLRCVSGVTGSELKQRIARILSGRDARKLDLWRRALLALSCLLAVSVPVTAGLVRAAHGQTQGADAAEKGGIAGTWQGTMRTPDGHDHRVVLKIVKDEKGGLNATLYRLDQGGPPVTGDSVRFQNGTLRFVNDFPGLKYEGKMSTDGNSIRGTVTQIGSFPLVLERATPETEWATPAPPQRILPMAPDAKPGVEVATIKPTQPGQRMFMLTLRGTNLVASNVSLTFLITFAYQVQGRQIVGGPAWMDSDRWDIEAKPDTPGMPNRDQMKVMVQKLLAERFDLRLHEENKEMTAYVLTVSNNGPKLTKSADESLSPNFAMGPLGVLHVQRATMGDFVRLLQGSILDRPVIDGTGLTGKWDFVLKWTPDQTQFLEMPVKVPLPDSGEANAPPPLFTAIQEQLGLKLEAQKTQVPALVIDYVGHPSPN